MVPPVLCSLFFPPGIVSLYNNRNISAIFMERGAAIGIVSPISPQWTFPTNMDSTDMGSTLMENSIKGKGPHTISIRTLTLGPILLGFCPSPPPEIAGKQIPNFKFGHFANSFLPVTQGSFVEPNGFVLAGVAGWQLCVCFLFGGRRAQSLLKRPPPASAHWEGRTLLNHGGRGRQFDLRSK